MKHINVTCSRHLEREERKHRIEKGTQPCSSSRMLPLDLRKGKFGGIKIRPVTGRDDSEGRTVDIVCLNRKIGKKGVTGDTGSWRSLSRIGVSRRGWVDLDGTDRGHQAFPSADVWFGQGRPAEGPGAAACSPRRGRARRNAARIGVSRRGWVDLDGTDRGHQTSPSADAWF